MTKVQNQEEVQNQDLQTLADLLEDDAGWDNDDENRLVLNCCKRGGLLIYGDEETEKV